MSGRDPKPLDEDVRAALEVERAAVFAPEDAKARVFGRVTGALGGSPGRPTGDDGQGARGGSSGSAMPPAGAFASARLLARPLSLAVSFALGSIAGVLVGRASHTSPPSPIVHIEHEAPIASAAPLATNAIAPVPTASVPPSAPTLTPSNTSPGNSLAPERALLDVARSAFGRGDGNEALAALSRHEKLYPNGQLAEEREALAVRALVQTDRGDQARARASRFRKRYPTSVMLPAVEAALSAMP
jgi:hypothetical protein